MDIITFEEEQYGDNYTANRLSITVSNPKRMSMDQYYISQQPHLPGYSALSQLQELYQPRPELSIRQQPQPQLQPESSVQQRPKLSIQPREDEGQEILPSYSSDISLQNVFMMKMELEGAVKRADDRNWNRVFVTLQGTALSFHKYKNSGVFGTRPEFLDDFPDQPVEGKKGEFVRSYNLHLADAGIAADYTKCVPPCHSLW